jgi:hypothetical protein
MRSWGRATPVAPPLSDQGYPGLGFPPEATQVKWKQIAMTSPSTKEWCIRSAITPPSPTGVRARFSPADVPPHSPPGHPVGHLRQKTRLPPESPDVGDDVGFVCNLATLPLQNTLHYQYHPFISTSRQDLELSPLLFKVGRLFVLMDYKHLWPRIGRDLEFD